MRDRLTILLLVAVLVFGKSSFAAASEETDHLSPTNTREYQSYRKLIHDRLEITPADCGRAVLLPPFKAEGSTSVYKRSSDGKYFVTDLQASRSLWDASDGGHNLQATSDVRVIRRDAEMPKETALLVQRVWIIAISKAKPLRRSPNVVATDATFAEFSVDNRGKTLRASLDFSLSYPGRMTGRLVDIWNKLYEYSRASKLKRKTLLDEIDAECSRFIKFES